MLAGEQFTFKLPQQLLLYDEAALSGDIKIGDERYFTYVTNKETREVTLTATDFIFEGTEGGIDFSAVFGNFATQDLNQTLEVQMPGKESLKLEFVFEPKVSGQNISKEGKLRTDENGAKFIDWEISKEVPVTYGKPLAKAQVGGNKYEANWKIEFNKLGKVVPQNTTITDTIAADNSHIVAEDIVLTKYVQQKGEWVRQGSLVQGIDYTITFSEDKKQFVITLLHADAIYAVDVTYKTYTTDEFIKASGAVNNVVETTLQDSSQQNYKVSTGFSYPEGIGTKQITDIDYANRTLEWRVVFNTEGKEVKNFTIADQFTNGLALVPYSDGEYFKVTSGQQADVTFTPVEENATGFAVSTEQPPTVTVPPGGNTGDSDTNNGTGTNTGSNNGTNAGTNTGTNTESNNGTNTGTNSGTGTNTGGATTNTGTNSNTGSNQNVSGAGSTAKPNTNRLPQTDVDSSTGYLQLLGVLVLAVAVFIFVRRRQLNK